MKFLKVTTIISLLLVLILNVGCEDDPVSQQEEHFEAIGTALFDASGALAVSIIRGETNDTLFATNNILSDHIEVKFYNEEEEVIDPPTDAEVKLNYSIEDETFVEFWQHPGEEGEFEFHLRGLKIGTTSIELFIEHDGHNDYRSGAIPVSVE